MRYTKPEIILLGEAHMAIQSSDGDKTDGLFETATRPTETPAYEADE